MPGALKQGLVQLSCAVALFVLYFKVDECLPHTFRCVKHRLVRGDLENGAATRLPHGLLKFCKLQPHTVVWLVGQILVVQKLQQRSIFPSCSSSSI